MNKNRVIITSPSLDVNKNVSGISSVANFIIESNDLYSYIHFELGKKDSEKRGVVWLFRNISAWIKWFLLMIWKRNLIIHFNLALDKPSLIRDLPLILFGQLLKKRMLIHIHGGEYLEKEKVPPTIKKILVFIFSGRQPIIVLSALEKEIIINKYSASNVIALPNSINLKESFDFDRMFSFKAPLKLLFIGRLVLRKGLEYIYEALKLLIEKKVDFEFFLAGTGPEKEQYVNKFSKLLESKFKYKGIVSGDKKVELLKECDIFLLPSIFGEGLPIALLETMSFSQVPIVTDVGSMSFVVNQNNGFIVEVESSRDIANAIEKLSNNRDLLQDMGQNARKLILTDFNPKIYIDRLNEIYNNT